MLSSRRDTIGASGGDPTLAAWLGQLQEAAFGQAGPPVRKAYQPTRRMTGTQLARYLGRRTYALASTSRPDGRAHAAPTLFSLYVTAFWLPTIDGGARLGKVRAHPWLIDRQRAATGPINRRSGAGQAVADLPTVSGDCAVRPLRRALRSP